MVKLRTMLCILFFITGDRQASGQSSGGGLNIQSFLNQFCLPGTTNPGCTGGSIITPDVAPPTVPPNAPPGSVGSFSSSESCSFGEKRCPQLPSKCVPDDIDCRIINSEITCTIPKAYGVTSQVLNCGDDTPVGLRCGSGGSVPVLTLLLVQCQDSNLIDPRPVASLDVISGPGDTGGAGVYQCSQDRTWKPKQQSPNLNQLTVSCRNAGCGRVPQPREDLPIQRRWAWVRALYKRGNLHCTATLVTSGAAVTAAHCLTRSVVDNRPEENLSIYELELPGPSTNNPHIRIQPSEIHLHPRYAYNNGEHKYDLAIIFFNFGLRYNLPTVCIADRAHHHSLERTQVVFSMKEGLQQTPFSPPGAEFGGTFWKSAKARWDHSCIATTTRNGAGCIDVLRVQEEQFCADHQGIRMTVGSSGGPYLAEVGENIEEVWVLMGVLSTFSNNSLCMQEHSVYGQVADNSRWVKDCVFDKRCRF